MAIATRQAAETVYVDRFCDGIIGPSPRCSARCATAATSSPTPRPGCWGPMITPAIKGGHEVTLPVAVEGAEVGDAIAIRIRSIDVTSIATSSGNDRHHRRAASTATRTAPRSARAAAGRTRRRSSRASAPDCVRCAECGAPAAPFAFTNGYTIAFDAARGLGVTVGEERATELAPRRRRHAGACRTHSVQNPILLFAPHDLVGAVARMRPFMGQLGTTPAVDLPDSHNAGDFGAFLLGAPHARAVTPEQLEHRTDGHMDIDAVRAGAILVCPVKVAGRRRLPRRHARDAGRRRDRRPHRRRRRARSRCRSHVRQGPRASTGRCCSRSRRTCRSWPGR